MEFNHFTQKVFLMFKLESITNLLDLHSIKQQINKLTLLD